MRVAEKLTLARQLDALGVDIIEAGFPIASPADAEAVRPIAAAGARAGDRRRWRAASPQDIERAGRALAPAPRTRIHMFIATSDLHLERKLRMTREDVPRRGGRRGHAGAPVHRRRGVFGGGCDAQRSGLPVPGHRGGDPAGRHDDQPARHGRLRDAGRDRASSSAPIIARVPNADQAIFSTHCHDDLGLAVANRLRGVQGGARQVECTINGIGERAGNASLEEIVMALRVRPDRLPFTTAHRIRASSIPSQPAADRAHRRSRSRRTRRSSAAMPSRTKPASTRTAC